MYFRSKNAFTFVKNCIDTNIQHKECLALHEKEIFLL